jgi:hypothetical protein
MATGISWASRPMAREGRGCLKEGSSSSDSPPRRNSLSASISSYCSALNLAWLSQWTPHGVPRSTPSSSELTCRLSDLPGLAGRPRDNRQRHPDCCTSILDSCLQTLLERRHLRAASLSQRFVYQRTLGCNDEWLLLPSLLAPRLRKHLC